MLETMAIPNATPRAEADTLWETLVARMQANDPAAFETALNLTRDSAWRLAVRMLGDPHLAQDVLQDAYVVQVTRIHSLRDPRAFRSWFLNIVLNTCRGALRHRQRHPLADPATEPAGAAFEEQVTRQMAVSKALDDLTPIERSVVLLRDYLQLSYHEMADVLRVPLGTVKSRLNEARKQLMRRLKGDVKP